MKRLQSLDALRGFDMIWILGLAVALDCPVVKNLWTPSFALLTGGYAFLMLALFHWFIDVKGHDRCGSRYRGFEGLSRSSIRRTPLSGRLSRPASGTTP